MEDIKFKIGITKNQINELIEYSKNDPQIINNTNDLVRFSDKRVFNNWIKIERTIYTLTNKAGNLLGIIWFRNQPLPTDKQFVVKIDIEKFGTTFGIRIYEPARGKGLSNRFLKNAFEKYKETDSYKNTHAKGFWLSTKNENVIAKKLYEKFGFQVVSSEDKLGRIVMLSHNLD